MPQLRPRLRHNPKAPPSANLEVPETTFRSRLRSHHSPPPLQSLPNLSSSTACSPQSPEILKVYQQFCESFGLHIRGVEEIGDSDVAGLFKESLARVGSELRFSQVDELMRIFSSNKSCIAALAHESSAATDEIKAFEANILQPLSTSAVSSDGLSRATVHDHLLALENSVSDGKTAVLALQQEHCSIVRQEIEVWKALVALVRDMKENSATGVANNLQAMEDFRHQAEEICEHQVEALREVEEDFKREMQLEMAKMMQQLME